jgi:hypothetical protein
VPGGVQQVVPQLVQPVFQPWRTEDFKISPDPLLIDKIRDVAGLYLAPPANAAVFAVGEKPQIQALERTAPVLPMLPGVPGRRSHDYVRHGANDFQGLGLLIGVIDHELAGRHVGFGGSHGERQAADSHCPGEQPAVFRMPPLIAPG